MMRWRTSDEILILQGDVAQETKDMTCKWRDTVLAMLCKRQRNVVQILRRFCASDKEMLYKRWGGDV